MQSENQNARVPTHHQRRPRHINPQQIKEFYAEGTMDEDLAPERFTHGKHNRERFSENTAKHLRGNTQFSQSRKMAEDISPDDPFRDSPVYVTLTPARENETATLRCVVSPELLNQSVTYCWYFSRSEGKRWAVSNLRGHEQPNMAIKMKSNRMENLYKCVITVGSEKYHSEPIGLYILPELPIKKEFGAPVIEVINVTKIFRSNKRNDGVDLGDIDSHQRKQREVAGNIACRDISFTIRQGERVAILGLNGSGKSTLIRLIAHTCYPTTGTVKTKGEIGRFFSYDSGVSKKLSGRENIKRLIGYSGLPKKRAKEIIPSIIDFTELGDDIDEPVSTYSLGMKSRLGYAITTAIQPDIIVSDGRLAVGDGAFKAKCLDLVKNMLDDQKTTLVYSTHSTAAAKRYCYRGIVLDEGSCIFDGDISEALNIYREIVSRSENNQDTTMEDDA